MPRAKELIPTEDKLKSLFLLQVIDSKIDAIRKLRGELPIEVQDLEDELEGLGLRISKLEDEIADLDGFINRNHATIAEAKALIERYSAQQMQVKNNREYDSLTRQIEMQNLEIQLCIKKNRDAEREKASKLDYLDESVGIRESRQKDLEVKEKELSVINAETKKEEQALIKKSEKAGKKIEDRLLRAYMRVRKNYRNGLAVVIVERDACGGCFGKVPPQLQLEIKQRKKIITCEHCGRILVDHEMEEEVTI